MVNLTKKSRNLVIFDLDDTLCHEGFSVEEYKESFLCLHTKDILEYLHKQGHVLAIASHNECAEQISQLCGILQYFTYIVGYCPITNTKMPLVQDILNYTTMSKEDVIFFDDVEQNVNEMNENGIRAKKVCWKIGITLHDLVQMKL